MLKSEQKTEGIMAGVYFFAWLLPTIVTIIALIVPP